MRKRSGTAPRRLILGGLVGVCLGMGGVVLLLLLSAGSTPRAPLRLPATIHTGRRGRPALHQIQPDRRLGFTAPGAPVSFSLVLRLPGERSLDRYLAALSNPRSPHYGHFIDPAKFGRLFGLSEAAMQRAREILRAQGVTIVREYPQRTALEVRAPAIVVDRLFGLQLQDYRDAQGSRYHSPRGTPHIPADLSPMVQAVAGLSTKPLLHPTIRPGVPGGSLTPSVARTAYDITPLFNAGIQGQGQTIAVVTFGGPVFVPSDVQTFDQQFGLPQTLPQAVPVNGGATASGNPGEANLDMEISHATAPQARVLDYEVPEVPTNGSFGTAPGAFLAPVMNTIVAQHNANVVSVSYGGCESEYAVGDMQNDNNALKALVGAGMSVFVASGDNGAYTCQRDVPKATNLNTAYPSSSPFVVSVGGTTLSLAQDGSYVGENPWVDVLSQGSGGGGLSSVFPRPSWQTGVPGVQNNFSNGMRQLPDVAANADNINTPWAIFSGGKLQPTGGTSASTPFWAGVMALIRQYAQQQGHGQLGPVPALFYQVAGTAFANTPFHDITDGTNRFYPATPGWDFATGLGSPDVFNLAQDIVSFQKQNGH